MAITVTGTLRRIPVELTYNAGVLTGDKFAILATRVAVAAAVEVGFAGGLGAGEATLDTDAPPARVAATMAYGLDTVTAVTGIEPDPLVPGTIP